MNPHLKSLLVVSIISFISLLFPCAAQAQTKTDDVKSNLEPVFIDIDAPKRDYYEKRGYAVLGEMLSIDTLKPQMYVAIKDITFPPGKQTILKPGVNILCEPGIKINVAGALIAFGGAQIANVPGPSLYDKDAVGKWAGIYIGNEGKLILSNAVIRGAENGIVINDTCNLVSLVNASFEFIAGSRIKIKGKDAGQGLLSPVNWQYPNRTERSQNDLSNSPLKLAEKKKWDASRVVRISAFGLVATGSGIAATAFRQAASKDKDNYTRETNPVKISEYNRKFVHDSDSYKIFAAIASVGIVGFAISFFF